MNPHGVVHGGGVSTLVDVAMGGALTSLLEAGERRAVSRSRRVAVPEARLYGEAQRLIALATGSFYLQAGAR